MMETKGHLTNYKDKPHHFEFGPSKQRHKVCYNTVEQLNAHIKWLIESGLVDPLVVQDLNIQ